MNKKMTYVMFAALLAASLAAALPARATQVGAWAGRPEDPNAWNCFYESWGAANTTFNGGCSWSAWEVELPVSAPPCGNWGTVKPTITYQQNCNSGETMWCGVTASYGDYSNNGYYYSGTGNIPAPCGQSSFQPGLAYFMCDMHVFAACYMNPGSEWYAVTW
jgi:hypothetical protein